MYCYLYKSILPAVFVFVCCTSGFAGTGTTLGLEYQSEYYWRGMSFYGEAPNSPRGVFFPSISQSLGGFNFSVIGEIPAAYLENQPNTVEKTWIGVDFTAAYQFSVSEDAVRMGLKTGYYMYPQSKEKSGYRMDSLKAAFTLQFKKIFLRPEFLAVYGARVGRQQEGRENYKDFYIKVTFDHSVALSEKIELVPGGWISYFHYPSSKTWNSSGYHGLCDIAGFLKVSIKIGSLLKLYGSFSTAVVTAPWHDIWGGQDRLHFWGTSGVSCTF